MSRRMRKLARLLTNWRFTQALVRRGVAAAVEHLDAIRLYAPATLIDVGANKGQFALAVRGLFPNAAIHAFEPLPRAAKRFEALFRRDAKVHLRRVAIGQREEARPFHVTDREDSSSLLQPCEAQRRAYGVAKVSEIAVPVMRLEDALDLSSLAPPVLLKIDVQGAELEVLKGIDRLDSIDCIHAELSFVELYEGQPLFEEVCVYLQGRGFVLDGLSNMSVTQAFGLTQADCAFVRAEPRAS